jgi:hypothetical protein
MYASAYFGILRKNRALNNNIYYVYHSFIRFGLLGFLTEARPCPAHGVSRTPRGERTSPLRPQQRSDCRPPLLTMAGRSDSYVVSDKTGETLERIILLPVHVRLHLFVKTGRYVFLQQVSRDARRTPVVLVDRVAGALTVWTCAKRHVAQTGLSPFVLPITRTFYFVTLLSARVISSSPGKPS